MISFKQRSDIPKARLPPHLAAYIDRLFTDIIKSLPDYHSDNDGYLALVTPRDTDKSLGDRLGWKWTNGCFEGISYDKASRCFVTMILRNNQFVISILIPDEPWLDPAIRDRMNREAA